MDAEELAKLSEAKGECGPMGYLGMRWGECAGLRVGRLDVLRSTLHVAEQFTRGKGGAMVLEPPKSQAGRHTMAVPAALIALFADHLARRGLTGADADEWVFKAPEGGHLDYAHFRRRVWIPATKAAGVEGLEFP